MNKKLKFDNLGSPRRLRSGKKVNNSNPSATTSLYFANEETSTAKNENKRRLPTKLKAAAVERAASTRFIKLLAARAVEEKSLEVKKEDDVATGSLTNVKPEILKEEENVEVMESTNDGEDEGKVESVDMQIKSETVEGNVSSSKDDDRIKVENVEEAQKGRSQRKKRTPVKIKYEDSQKKEKNTSSENVNVDMDTGKSKWMPTNWEKTLEYVKEMRKHKTAPVDEMGCHKCADPNASDRVFRYQSLIALMLSSQTKDQVTHAATQRLNAYGCTPETIVATPDDVLGKLIYPVGFWKKKVDYIKKCTQILIDKHGGDIPRTVKGLCELPGVGPKMAHICMQIAWGEVSGIGVDTHVHRICNRLEWVRKPTKTPEETRMELEDWLPKDIWKEVNHLLVGFGQEICLPRFPKCKECLNRGICPYAIKNGIKQK